MCLGIMSRTSVPAPSRLVGPSSKQPSTLQARLLDARADQGLLPSAGNPPGCSNPVPSGCAAVQIDPLIQNGPHNGVEPANRSRHVGTPLGTYVPGLPVFTWRDAAQNTSFKASCAERGPPI